jgi:hypothetical protein
MRTGVARARSSAHGPRYLTKPLDVLEFLRVVDGILDAAQPTT